MSSGRPIHLQAKNAPAAGRIYVTAFDHRDGDGVRPVSLTGAEIARVTFGAR